MIPLFKVAMNPEAEKAVANVLNSGFIGQGSVCSYQIKNRSRNKKIPRKPYK